MNRRTLMAGMAAIVPATVGAQATPDANQGTAYGVMTDYLETVIRDGDLDAIPILFGGDLDIDAVTWDHADMQAMARGTGDTFTIDIRVIFGDDTNAIAYIHYGPPDVFRRALFVAIQVRSREIIAYRWMQEYV